MIKTKTRYLSNLLLNCYERNGCMTDRFVIGYSDDERGKALVILRPIDPERSMDYEEVCTCTGEEAAKIYESITGR